MTYCESIVNVVGSSIARAADYVMYTYAGPEIAVASTKAYMVQMCVLYLFALRLAYARGMHDFDPAEYFDRKDIRHMERFTQIAVASAVQALKDAGSDFKDMDPYRVGTIIGCGIGGIGRIEEEHDKYRAKGPGRISPFFVPMMIGNMAAGQVAIRTGFRGDNFCTTTACASATHAIGEAFRKIKDGYLDVCLCGGSESTITEFTLGGFRTMKALTTESDPAKASTPFDLNRGGFVLGEGSAVLVLEEYEHAKARGAKIYCELAGYGATCDAYHMMHQGAHRATARGTGREDLSEARGRDATNRVDGHNLVRTLLSTTLSPIRITIPPINSESTS